MDQDYHPTDSIAIYQYR